MSAPISFNPKQQKVIDHTDGSLVVLAPVGTGKTSVLSARVAKAIHGGIAPNRILCLTFTNRAATEMGNRLAQSLPQVCRQLTIKTFHGLCAWMLRLEAQTIGLPADFVVYDDSDCFDILKALSRLEKDGEVRDLMSAIEACKSRAPQRQLSLELTLGDLFTTLDPPARLVAKKYQKALSNRHALDFADLVFYTRSMLQLMPAVAERWANRFDLVQVDEVQDTHLGEYEVVSHLASKSRNLALIGDLDQTIYAWRGSEPDVVLTRFKAEFCPTAYDLSLNYRATRTLLRAASAFADQFKERHTQITPSPTCDIGEKIRVHTAANEAQEAQWIAAQIATLAQNTAGFRYDRLSILTRTNRRAQCIAAVLMQEGIPCITVEQYQFFLRQEIKDALAYLRFITNPFDTGAFRRLVTTPRREIGQETLRAIYREGQPCGFRLTDLAKPQPFMDDDPLGAVIEGFLNGTLVVFDVETTGTAVGSDIIEIAAVRLVNGDVEDQFHAYIADAADVGDSKQIHGYSNEFLRQNGQPAKAVLASFCQFAGASLLVGHNVGFDIKMVVAHAQKVGLQTPMWQWADTWNLASRFVQAESYSLANLARQLNLASTPNHHAMDDVETTVQLLRHLIPHLLDTAADRVAIYYRYGEQFAPLAEEIARWTALSQTLRPAQLLEDVLDNSGLTRLYQPASDRSQNLKQLVHIFCSRDDAALHPDTALRSILEFAALAKNLDQISAQDNQAVIITTHQSKGLEFDYVFVAGMSEGEFPFYRSIQDGLLEEEKRLFYVALTRAKKRLHLSCFRENYWGSQTPSQFWAGLPSVLVEQDP